MNTVGKYLKRFRKTIILTKILHKTSNAQTIINMTLTLTSNTTYGHSQPVICRGITHQELVSPIVQTQSGRSTGRHNGRSPCRRSWWTWWATCYFVSLMSFNRFVSVSPLKCSVLSYTFSPPTCQSRNNKLYISLARNWWRNGAMSVIWGSGVWKLICFFISSANLCFT